MNNATGNLTWNDAVDQAMEPTDLDHRLTTGLFGTGDPIVGEDGKLNDYGLVRERAVHAYVNAHEGEYVEVNYADPAHVDEATRVTWSTHGTLTKTFVTVPVFIEEGRLGNWTGLVVGGTVVPVRGITALRVTGDRSVVTL